MTVKIAFVMDDLDTIQTYKDSTFALMLEAQERGWGVYYLKQEWLFYQNNQVMSYIEKVEVYDDSNHWYKVVDSNQIAMKEMDVVWMRKDPPVDDSYLYTTMLLKILQDSGVVVINDPVSLATLNEKLWTLTFDSLIPPTLVSSNHQLLKDFLKQHQEAVIKPLNGMGGKSVFKLEHHHVNTNAILETLTMKETQLVIIQSYIKESQMGDKRVILINGEAVNPGLLRIPAKDEFRANLAVGGKGVVSELSERDRLICNTVGKIAKTKGLFLVGLDIVGDYLTEINITSPTCLREITQGSGVNVSQMVLTQLENLYL